MVSDRFHGRIDGAEQPCQAPGCTQPGEFRAPIAGREGAGGFDGPSGWRWFCLTHIREFNAGYDWFDGMSADEILAAQSPAAMWASESPSFRKDAGVDGLPRWADFVDPLDAIGGRAAQIRRKAEQRAGFGAKFGASFGAKSGAKSGASFGAEFGGSAQGGAAQNGAGGGARQSAGRHKYASRFTAREREAMDVLGLSPDADRAALRRQYSALVRRYHPDRNGGNRKYEGRLVRVVEAYQLLRKNKGISGSDH